VASPHCIESLQFDVDFGSAEHAFEEQERVAAFARARAPKIIDEVFDQFSQQFSHSGQVWRFATLEIDLGHVDRGELEQQWEARLRERLAEALQEQQAALRGHAQPQPSPAGTEPPAEQRSREQAQLDTLLHFLQRGHLPWNAPQAQALASPIEQLAHEVLRDSPQALVVAWRYCPEARVMVQRAARQFSPTWLARLAKELARSLGVGEAASWGREAEAWVQGFAALWGESRLPSSPPMHLLWQGLLTALWADAGVVDRSQPLHSMVQAVASAVGEQTTIWRALQAVARRAVDGTPPAPTATLSDELLRTCLAAQLPALADTGTTEGEQAASSRSDELARLQLRLQAWFSSHTQDDDLSPWSELLHAEPSWARQTLLLLGRSVAARRRMAQALPPATLLALMALWLGPTEQSLLQAALPSAALWGAGASAPEAAQRWELTLSHVLLHPAPALFNANDYLDDMLQQRSERENRPAAGLLRELAEAWHESGPRDPASAPPHASMQAWLRLRLPAEPLWSSRTALRRARLEAVLAQGLLTGAEDDWFESLRSDTAWLQDLLRRLGRHPALLRRVARDWGMLPRIQLIGLWLPAPDRAAVIAAMRNPALAGLAGADEARPELFLWEDLLAHLLRLTPGTFFNADAYVRGLRERAALAGGKPTANRSTDADQPDEATDDDAHDLTHYLLNEQPLSTEDLAAFTQGVAQLLQAPRPAQRRAWLRVLELPRAAQRLVTLLPAQQLSRVLAWLRPAEHEAVEQSTLLMHTASLRLGAPATTEILTRLSWQFVLCELFEEGRRFEPVGFSVRLAQHLVTMLRPPEPQRWLARLAAEVSREALPPVGPRIAAAIAAAANAPVPPTPAPAPVPAAAEAVEEIAGEVIYIANAGMVLAGAYLQRLFTMLGLADNEAFVSPDAAERAVHLLQYLATGSAEAPEPLLVLNKVLCGLPIGAPVLREFAITPQETEAIDGLLQAMIAHWKIIGHTTPAGLRESFLQREGRLSFDEDDGWQLQVEPRSFDMLLDQLPWGYSLQKLPWMKRPLHVEWR